MRATRANRIPKASWSWSAYVGGRPGSVARVAAPHYYRDSRPAMAQPLNRSLSEADLLAT